MAAHEQQNSTPTPGEAVYTAYLEKSKRTSASILGWDPQSLREDLRKLGWTGGDVEDAVTYWSSLPRAPPQGTPSGWRRDLTMECVEPNPGPTLAEILAGLRTKLAADADAFEDDIKQFEAKIREAYPNIRTPSDIQVGQFLQEHENVVNTIFKDDATNVKKFIQELLPKAPPGPNTDTPDAQFNQKMDLRIATFFKEWEEGRILKKRRISTSGFTFTLPLSDLSNQQMRDYMRDTTVIQEVDDVLTCEASEAIAALKWLQLHSMSITGSLLGWKAHSERLKQAKSNEDGTSMVGELVYYPLLLLFFQAAALGQKDIVFLKQNYSKPAPREDIIGMVKGVAECPCENKLVIHASSGGNGGGVKANMLGFAGLARCLSKIADDTLLNEASNREANPDQAKSNTPPKKIREYLCTFTSRVTAVFIAKIGFDFEDKKIVSLTVGPKFPEDRNYDKVLLCPTKEFATKDSLSGVLPKSYTPGFMLLVRLVAELRLQKELPAIHLILQYEHPIKKTHQLSGDVEVLHQGSKSVVLHEKNKNTCIKISFAKNIGSEWTIHTMIDSPLGTESHLRRGLGTGIITGAGDGLRFIELEGFGEPFDTALKKISADNREMYWKQACSGLDEMHKKGYLHGDVKPGNIILLDNKLKINDFDLCCKTGSIPFGKTNYFASPRVVRTNFGSYTARDDYVSLILSFLSMWNITWNNEREKEELLKGVGNKLHTIPEYLKVAVKEYCK